jgi:hypothetical protein
MPRYFMFIFVAAIASGLANAATLEDAAKMQQQLLDQKETKETDQNTAITISNQMEERTFALFYKTYSEAKNAGINLADTKQDINEMNRNRRNVGVWEFYVAKDYDNGRFVIITDGFTGKKAAFDVAGTGLFLASGRISDPSFDHTGTFSASCEYELSVANSTKAYNCGQFLVGQLDAQIAQDMRGTLVGIIKHAMTPNQR